MKMTNIKTETYAYDKDDNYLIDVVTIDNGYEAYLYHFDYGYKMLMFGNAFSKGSYEDFVALVEDSISEYITIYRQEIEKKVNNTKTGFDNDGNPLDLDITIEELLSEIVDFLPNIYDVDDDFKLTHFVTDSNYSEILSSNESDIEVLNKLFTQLYGKYTVNTGYYDPVEDERNNEVDVYTGMYYVTIN